MIFSTESIHRHRCCFVYDVGHRYMYAPNLFVSTVFHAVVPIQYRTLLSLSSSGRDTSVLKVRAGSQSRESSLLGISPTLFVSPRAMAMVVYIFPMYPANNSTISSHLISSHLHRNNQSPSPLPDIQNLERQTSPPKLLYQTMSWWNDRPDRPAPPAPPPPPPSPVNDHA